MGGWGLSDGPWAGAFLSFEVHEVFGNRAGWWLHNMVTVLGATELFTLTLCDCHLNKKKNLGTEKDRR